MFEISNMDVFEVRIGDIIVVADTVEDLQGKDIEKYVSHKASLIEVDSKGVEVLFSDDFKEPVTEYINGVRVTCPEEYKKDAEEIAKLLDRGEVEVYSDGGVDIVSDSIELFTSLSKYRDAIERAKELFYRVEHVPGWKCTVVGDDNEFWVEYKSEDLGVTVIVPPDRNAKKLLSDLPEIIVDGVKYDVVLMDYRRGSEPVVSAYGEVVQKDGTVVGVHIDGVPLGEVERAHRLGLEKAEQYDVTELSVGADGFMLLEPVLLGVGNGEPRYYIASRWEFERAIEFFKREGVYDEFMRHMETVLSLIFSLSTFLQ